MHAPDDKLPSLKVLTVGQAAKLCNAAPRTVSRWFDSGKLRGYRIPGSQDRRIPREHLIRFLTENGMPLGDLAETPVEAAVQPQEIMTVWGAVPQW